jgi:hypothetical protein
MRLSRIITALLAGLAVAGAPTAAGAAQPAAPPSYPPTAPSLTLSDNAVVVGQTVRLFGRGFGSNEDVEIRVTRTPLAARAPGGQPAGRNPGTTVAMVPVAYQLPSKQPQPSLAARTDAAGNFTTTYRATEVGEFTFVATGLSSGRTASATLVVLGAPPLPVTGSDIGPQLAVGGGLLLTGVLLLMLTVVWRRRSRGRERELETVH